MPITDPAFRPIDAYLDRLIEAMNYTAINTPSDVSEWSLSGLTQEPSVKVKPARVKEAAISMECELCEPIAIFHRQLC